MVELPILGDRGVKDRLREVISTDVPTDGDGVSSESFDLLNDKLSFLLVKAAEIGESMRLGDGKINGTNALADYNLCTFFGKDDSSTPSNSL